MPDRGMSLTDLLCGGESGTGLGPSPLTPFRILVVLAVAAGRVGAAPSPRDEPITVRGVVEQHCLSCHDAHTKKGGLDLSALPAQDFAKNPEPWEKVIRKLRTRQMPPAGKPRPDERTYVAILNQ